MSAPIHDTRSATGPIADAESHPAPPAGIGLIVLGLGNDILGDDSIGLRVVRALRQRQPQGPRHDANHTALADAPDPIVITESSEAGLALLDALSGFATAVIVDAIQTGTRPAGFVHRVEAEELSAITIGSPHFLGIPETLALGRSLGLPMPDRVTLFAIEVEDPYTLSTSLSPRVAAAFPRIVASLDAWLGRPPSSRRSSGTRGSGDVSSTCLENAVAEHGGRRS